MQLYAININHSNCHKKRNVHFECGRARTNSTKKKKKRERMRERERRQEATAKETRQANLQLKCLSQDKFCAYAKVGQDTGKGHKDLWLGFCRAVLERHYAYAALSTILSPIYVLVCVPQLTNATTARECEYKAKPRPTGPRPKAKQSQACPGDCQCNTHTHTHTFFYSRLTSTTRLQRAL